MVPAGIKRKNKKAEAQYTADPDADTDVNQLGATQQVDYYAPTESLDELVTATRQRLGALIAEPALTTALLEKPPFRFLHDVVSALTRATGFGEGLFRGKELSAAALKDKKAKEAYLRKLIAAVEEALGETLGVRPGKVVCGEEPEQTNLLLQALARAAERAAATRAAAFNTSSSASGRA